MKSKFLVLSLTTFFGLFGGASLRALTSDASVEVVSEEEKAALEKVYKSPKYDEGRDYAKDEYEEEVLKEKEAQLKKIYEKLFARLEGEEAAKTRAAWAEAQTAWVKFSANEAYARAAAFTGGGRFYSTHLILEYVDLVIGRMFSVEAVLKEMEKSGFPAAGAEGAKKVVSKKELALARERLSKANAAVKQWERKLLGVFKDEKDPIEKVAREDILKVPKRWKAFQEADGKARAMVATGGATERDALELARLEAMTGLAERRVKVLKEFHAEADRIN